MNADDALLHKAEYYIRYMVRNSDVIADDDADADVSDVIKDHDDDRKRLISLRRLLTFLRLPESCEYDIVVLR